MGKKRHITGLYALRPFGAWPTENRSRGYAPLCGFLPAHLGRGSMLRIALLPAPNVAYNRNVMRNFFEFSGKVYIGKKII
jgi:hypothetical protein